MSGQLQAENFAMAFGAVYTFGPTFRAENSNTARHAAEFWMVEPEIAFADLEDDMNLAEAMLKYVIRYCHGQLPRRDRLCFNSFVDKGLLKERLEHVATPRTSRRVSYTNTIEIRRRGRGGGPAVRVPGLAGACDLATEHERFLTEQHFKKPGVRDRLPG